MRNLILAASALTLAVPVLPAAAVAQGAQQSQTWRGSDGRVHCKRPNGTTGLIAGGAAGVLAGRAVDKRGSRTTGSILGGALGALLGRHVVSRCR